MKIFITGGSGFIGSHLVPKLLTRKHKLLLLSRKRSGRVGKSPSSIKGDLKNINGWKNKLKKFRPDAVIHLAWEGLENYDFSAGVSLGNMMNSLNLISVAAELGCKKFLSVGSCWEYGDGKGSLKESASLLPPAHVLDFVIAKRTIQAMGEQIALQNKMQFLWPRLFFAYGPGQKSRTLIAHLVRSFGNGVMPEVKNKSGANDFVYIDDVVEALVKILEKSKKPSVIYNVGSGRLTSVAEVVKEVYENLNLPAPKWSVKKVRSRGFYANISKIKKELGWKPKTGISEGVKKTVEYFSKKQI
ncbi:MAG: NAD(P)-dependent oxidoreductase [Patescibacteria group bacterium]